jgi:hypothetical protein
MWIVPSEFSKALEGLARLAGVDPGESSSWLSAQGAEPGRSDPIDTDGWFDSNLPPAAAQPEARNLRASDSDADSLLAREGLADDAPPPPPPPQPNP